MPARLPTDASETALLARLRAGDDEAYASLVRDHGARMLLAARRILGNEEDAQDALQEAFLSAFKSLASFHGDARLSTWLHRIAINAALMKLRSRRHEPEEEIDELLPEYTEAGGHHVRQPEAWGEEAYVSMLRDETRAIVRNNIERLPEAFRVALLLRDIEGLSNEEVAEQLGISVNAAKIRVHRARQALRTLLDPIFAGVGA